MVSVSGGGRNGSFTDIGACLSCVMMALFSKTCNVSQVSDQGQETESRAHTPVEDQQRTNWLSHRHLLFSTTLADGQRQYCSHQLSYVRGQIGF